MKVLITIPHYYKPRANGMYGSYSEAETDRIRVLERVVTAWYELFVYPAASVHQKVEGEGATKKIYALMKPADKPLHIDLTLVFVTTEQEHLLNKTNLDPKLYRHQQVKISDPRYLGFACHRVLASHRGEFDYYCFSEDDLIVHDLYFFRKLAWFEKTFGSGCLLQPNRYMTRLTPVFTEYLDFEYQNYTENWIDYTRQPMLETEYLAQPIKFFQTRNPHAGCFFLSATQYDMMCEREGYAQPNSQFAGPLESAASYDLMRTFDIYRAEYAQAAFLSIEHIGKRPGQGAPRVIDNTEF